MISLVSQIIIVSFIVSLSLAHISSLASGFRKTHPIPADVGRYAAFDALAAENKRVLQAILSSDVVPATLTFYDQQLLKKLRGLYSSCMDESTLDQLGSEPLLHVTRMIKRLFRGDTFLAADKHDENDFQKRLTAAISYIHSRGTIVYSVKFTRSH